MQILSIQPTFSFTSKNQAVNNVLKQFDKDMLTYKTRSVSVKKQRLALEEKYVAGMKLVDIAAMLKVDPETVNRVLKKMGVKKS